jgi:uncharacterized protein (TIGR02171 family)
MVLVWLTAPFFFLVLCAPTDIDPIPQPSRFKEMVLINAEGKTFFQGSNDSMAKTEAKPAFKVTFSYNFWIDTIEVTQELFYRVTQRNRFDSLGNNIPAVSVTWFDAIRFCNARSKLDSLDTVYSFSGIDTMPSGRTFSLSGLSINYMREGYRLPTESEWEYCAKAGSVTEYPWGIQAEALAPAYAWYNTNSGGTLHPVASLQPNAWKLYDMAGNALEWTNDAKGSYITGAISDPLGALADYDAERVVKGGAFSRSILELRCTNRSDVYPALPSAALNYLGFRCVIGGIRHGNYYTKDGTTVTNASFRLTEPNFQYLVGSSHIKVVFVNEQGADRILTCLEFAKGVYRIFQYPLFTNVHAPVVSPNGEWVAFCTGDMGGEGTSSVFVQRLDSAGTGFTQFSDKSAFFPRWWVDHSNSDTFIVYSSSAVVNTDASWLSSSTLLQEIRGGKPVGSPRLLTTDGSYYGGLSYSGKYLATGYPRALIRDMTVEKVNRIFLGPANGKGEGDSSQVCNVSLSPSPVNEDRMIFLDFGFKNVNQVVGGSYRSHQIVFMSDWSGRVLNWFWCPISEDSWDHPKWSNNPRFAAAVGVSAEQRYHSIYILDLVRTTSFRILSGDNMYQPCLWIDTSDLSLPASDISFDSIGRYNNPPTTFGQAELAQKLVLFWHVKDSLEVVFVGSSMMAFGIDPSMIKGFRSINLGFAGGDFLGSTEIIRDYILNHCPKVKLISLSIDLGWFANPDGDFTWKGGPSQTVGFKYDQNHGFWKDGLPAGFIDIVGLSDGTLDSHGFRGATANGWGNNPPIVIGRTDWNSADSNYIVNIERFYTLVAELSARGIQVLAINFPVSPFYKNISAYSTWGPSWTTAVEVLEQIRAMEEKLPKFHLYDANQNGDHGYTEADAFDPNHLSTTGAIKISSQVNNIIDSLLKK